jgi:hypothetical protein
MTATFKVGRIDFSAFIRSAYFVIILSVPI